MKKIGIGISLIVLLLGPSRVDAQRGNMGNHGGMMGQGHMKDHGSMMGHGQMMGDMMGMSDQMSIMMSKYSGMMKGMRTGNMKIMSSLMKEMSHQMMEMATAVGKDNVSVKEMKHLQNGMTHLHQRMSGMETHR